MTDQTNIHTCSYYCNRPACVKSQRDELRDRFIVHSEVEQLYKKIDALKTERDYFLRELQELRLQYIADFGQLQEKGDADKD